MYSYQDFKSFYRSNILLFIILLFVVIYIIINWSKVTDGNYFGGEYTKPILITGIIFLISHMLITWDDITTSTDNDIKDIEDIKEIVNIPKYKFQNNFNDNQIKNDIVAATALPKQNILPEPTALPNPVNQSPPQSLNSKYRIVKSYDTNSNNHRHNFMNFANNHSNDDSRLSNRNIFISHKNSSKYGLKF